MDTLIIRELDIERGSDDRQIFSSGKGKEEVFSNTEKFNSEQDSNLRIITNNLHRLNNSIVQAVRNGLTVEIKRASRFHSGSGKWGDQIYLAITKDV